MDKQAKFWQVTPMHEMTPEQWELLCDGCAKCCRMQFIDEDDDLLMQTDVVCHLLDKTSLQCSDYANRTSLVPDCVQITPDNIQEFYWLPDSCGYRRVAAGLDLPDWHHLVTGDKQQVHKQGFSVLNKVISENELIDQEIEDRIISWIPISD